MQTASKFLRQIVRNDKVRPFFLSLRLKRSKNSAETISCGSRTRPPRTPRYIPQNPWTRYLTWQKGLASLELIKDPETGRVPGLSGQASRDHKDPSQEGAGRAVRKNGRC